LDKLYKTSFFFWESGKAIEVGDSIGYIIGKPKHNGFAPDSRKKKDRELFSFVKNKFGQDSLEQFKKALDGHKVPYKFTYETTQRGITLEEYESGEQYNATAYWSSITSPVIEILRIVYPKMCYEDFGHIWGLTNKQIDKIVEKLDSSE